VLTVFPPAPPQLKEEGVTDTDGVPQLSVEPLFTCAAVMEADPPVRFTDTLRHKATGGVLSITVTTAAQFPALPDASVTVRVTLLEPG
jgi:hypothetical protein